MAVNNFNESDLVGNSLQRLLDEVRDLASDGTKESYEKLTTFVVELGKVASNANVKVDTQNEGHQSTTIRNEEIDYIGTISQVEQIIREETDKNSANTEQQEAREILRETVASTIGVLLKEDEIRNELLQRNLTPADYNKHINTEIEKSKRQVNLLRGKLNEVDATIALFGESIPLSFTRKEWMQKSDIKTLKDDKEAKEHVDKLLEANKLLDEFKQLKDANNSPRVLNSPSKDQDIARNEARMQEIIVDVRGIAGDLKALDIRVPSDPNVPTVRSQKMDLTLLENLALTSDIDAVINDTTSKQTTLETMIGVDYSMIISKIENNPSRFGFANAAEVSAKLVPGGNIDRAAVDKLIDDLEKTQSTLRSEIAYEEKVQANLEAARAEYEHDYNLEQTLSGKMQAVTRTEPVYQQRRDPTTGQMVTVTDANGNPVQEMEDRTDANGNVTRVPRTRTVTDFIPTDAARREYLRNAGVPDENQFIQDRVNTARRDEQDRIDSLSNAEKRQLMRQAYRQDGRRHPILWLRSQFAPNQLWRSRYESQYLTASLTSAENQARAAATTDLEGRWRPAFEEDVRNRDNAREVRDFVRAGYKSAIASAVSQEKVTDELYRGTPDPDVRRDANGDLRINNDQSRSRMGLDQSAPKVEIGAERAAAVTSVKDIWTIKVQQAARDLAAGRITQSEYDRIQYSFRESLDPKLEGKTIQDRAHADEINTQNTGRTTKTPDYEDR